MPIRDDLIQRTVEQIAQVIAFMLGQRDDAAFDRAAAAIETAYREHTGSGRALMTRLGSDDLISILSTAGSFDREKGYLVAALLWAETQLLLARGVAVSPDLRLKALDLFLESSLAGLDTDDLDRSISELWRELDEYTLPDSTVWRLFDHRTLRGRYLGAEELLFDLLERRGASDELASRGRAFYRELAGVPDAKLEQAGLTREEAEIGAEEFEAELTERGRN